MLLPAVENTKRIVQVAKFGKGVIQEIKATEKKNAIIDRIHRQLDDERKKKVQLDDLANQIKDLNSKKTMLADLRNKKALLTVGIAPVRTTPLVNTGGFDKRSAVIGAVTGAVVGGISAGITVKG